MSTIDKTLTGSDFCNADCTEKQSVIHPQTCVGQVLITNDTNSTLVDWFNSDIKTEGKTFSETTNLLDWLKKNYPISNYALNPATTNVLGGIMLGENNPYLSIDDTGTLSVNRENLKIPEISGTSYYTEGTIKLGNSTFLTGNFEDSQIPSQLHDDYSYNGRVYAFPLRLDNHRRAGVVIPTKLFNSPSTITQLDWTFDYSDYATNVTLDQIVTGTNTNYILLGNKSINNSNGKLGYDNNNNISTSYGYPRIAFVAGSNITFKRFNSAYVPSFSNPWGDNITEFVISADTKLASNTTIGGIQLGYDNTSDTTKLPVEVNAGQQAYVDVSSISGAPKNHVVTTVNSIWDKYDYGFNTYDVMCNISGETIKIARKETFTKNQTNYSNNIANNSTAYEWVIPQVGIDNNIGIIDVSDNVAKGFFQLDIEHTNGAKETHNVGFVINTQYSNPHKYTLMWCTTCDWEVKFYDYNNTDRCVVYLIAPTKFTGKVKVSNKICYTSANQTIYSLNDATRVSWATNTTITNGSTSKLIGNLISTPQYNNNSHVSVFNGYKIVIDTFISSINELNVSDSLYDYEINDAIMHRLTDRVSKLEAIVQSLI